MLDSKFHFKTAISILYGITSIIFILFYEYAHLNINWALALLIICIIAPKILDKFAGNSNESIPNS